MRGEGDDNSDAGGRTLEETHASHRMSVNVRGRMRHHTREEEHIRAHGMRRRRNFEACPKWARYET